MQNIFSRISQLVLLLPVLLVSCAKNLDQTPQSTANRDAVFGSEDGLKLYTNSFYNMLPDINTPFRTDCDLSDYGATTSVPTYLRTGAFSSRQSSGWSWTDLRNVNYFIQNCNNPAVSQTVRENYIGLAKFFRAYFYFEKVKRFGDVPWYSKPLDVSDSALYKARDSRTVIMDSILADLDYAAAHITATDDATRSTITKWIVYGFKSRVCLFEGTFRKYQTSYGLASTATQFLQAAADAAQAVMNSGKYSLNKGGNMAYRNLFISATPITSEVMLSNISSTSLAKFNDANWYFTSATYGPRFNFTRTFINTYL
ncbi:MAG TPA: RagB/SusD family nutrient uptake outer membrane protein, partial [Sediminibacterium sp.]|nr:RagB/SusD family nutrient uptake outer membrane protein [Sediminibacterium sp.]